MKRIYLENQIFRIAVNLVCGALVFGTILPFFYNQSQTIYYKYIDTTQYYKLNSVRIKEIKNYHACDEIILIGDQISLINSRISVIFYAQNTAVNQSYPITEINGQLTPDAKEVTLSISIPCIVPAGKYKIKGSVQYSAHDIGRVEYFSTETINVTEKIK